MKKIIIYICILNVLIMLFFKIYYNSNNKIYEDITILGILNDFKQENEYKITCNKTLEVDVFTTINNIYKKIAPGSRGSFSICFKNPLKSEYEINIVEKTKKPKNLVFMIENKIYKTIEEVEKKINECFVNEDKVIIDWEWQYYINENFDSMDTEDGEIAQKYAFEVIIVAK